MRKADGNSKVPCKILNIHILASNANTFPSKDYNEIYLPAGANIYHNFLTPILN